MGSIAPPEARRVVLLTERADFYGGGQRSLRDLARALTNSAWSPVVVLPGPGPLAEALAGDGVPVRHLALPPAGPIPGARFIGTVRRLAALLRTEHAAVVHSDAPRCALYAGLAARVAGVKHVWHLRASRPGAPGTDRLLHGLSHRIVAVSRAAATRSAVLRRSGRVVVVPTGMRPPDFLDRRTARGILDLPQAGLLVGVIGRVERDKGGDDAIDAMARLVKVAPGTTLAFLGASDPDSPYRAGLERHAERLGIAGAVRFLGEHPEASRLLRAFDFILHPSRHEALPRALIESLWASVPSASYAIGGVAEVVGTGVDAGGLLAPAGRLAALVRLAERLALDPDLRRALGSCGAQRARERFALETMTDAITAEYDRLVPRAGRPARPRRGDDPREQAA